MTFIVNSQRQNPKEVKTGRRPREEPRIPSFNETLNFGKRKNSLKKNKGEKSQNRQTKDFKTKRRF